MSKKRKKRISKLSNLQSQMQGCRECKLSKHRCHLVFGEGNVCAKLVILGEYPSVEDDTRARPFRGEAGKFLRDMLEEINVDLEDIFMMHMVGCKPPRRRAPEVKEIRHCLYWVKKRLAIIKPNLIITVGNVPTQTLLNTQIGILKLRGKTKIRGQMRLFPMPSPKWLMMNQGKSACAEYKEDLLHAVELSKQVPSKETKSWWKHLKN